MVRSGTDTPHMHVCLKEDGDSYFGEYAPVNNKLPSSAPFELAFTSPHIFSSSWIQGVRGKADKSWRAEGVGAL